MKRPYRLTPEGREILRAIGEARAKQYNATPLEERRPHMITGGKVKNPNKGFGTTKQKDVTG